MLHRDIQKLLDLLELAGDLRPLHSEDRAVQVNFLPAFDLWTQTYSRILIEAQASIFVLAVL